MTAIKTKRADLPSLEIDLDIRAPQWETLDFDLHEVMQDLCVHVLDAGLPDQAVLPGFLELSAVFTNDADIQTLNADYRGKDKPTNVLSFPQQEDIRMADADFPVIPPLGDLVFAYETIEREACEQNKSLHDHLSHLIVHGTLHLLGYNHIEEDEAEEMENLEIAILSQNGINNPYLTD